MAGMPVLPPGLVRHPRRYPAARRRNAGLMHVCLQVLLINNERFMVPEVLFRPSDIGLHQAGLAQTIVDAVEAVHSDLHPLLYSNVLCTGGSARCPGFRDRLYQDLRPLVPSEYEVNLPPSQERSRSTLEFLTDSGPGQVSDASFMASYPFCTGVQTPSISNEEKEIRIGQILYSKSAGGSAIQGATTACWCR